MYSKTTDYTRPDVSGVSQDKTRQNSERKTNAGWGGHDGLEMGGRRNDEDIQDPSDG